MLRSKTCASCPLLQVVLGGVYLLMPGTAKVYRELQEYLLRTNPSKSSVMDGLDTFSRSARLSLPQLT